MCELMVECGFVGVFGVWVFGGVMLCVNEGERGG